MSNLTLNAQPRELTGRKVSQLRTQGLVPVVVYGRGQEPAVLQVNARSFNDVLHAGGISQLVELVVDGGKVQNVLVRELQHHPVKNNVIHADLYAVSMTEKQQVDISVVAVNEPEALVAGLMMLQAMDQVSIEALPANIPASIEIDVTQLDMDRAITVADLPQVEGVTYLSEADESVFIMVTTRTEESLEEEELAVEGEEMIEPEVMTRGKDEEEEEEG